MANTATTLFTNMPIGFDHKARFSGINGYKCVFDTLATDLTILTPAADAVWGIVGLIYRCSSAHSITFTSGSTVVSTIPIPANDGIGKGIGAGEGLLLVGNAVGEALKIQCATAVIPMLTIYVCQFKLT